jgi:hypothetical protein
MTGTSGHSISANGIQQAHSGSAKVVRRVCVMALNPEKDIGNMLVAFQMSRFKWTSEMLVT